MHLRIDNARQDVQPLAIDHLAGGIGRKIAQRHDALAAHADIALALPVVIDQRAVLENHVIVRHV
jgi:hypothetical protein